MANHPRVTGIRVESVHISDCSMRNAPQPFACLADTPEAWLSKAGLASKHRNWMWFRFRCNDPDCTSTVVVRSDVIDRAITRALGGAR